jgi:hypothetical protein
VQTFEYVDWTVLLKKAQILNGGQLCVFDGPYYARGRYIVYCLKFIEGGQLWLVRISILSAALTFDLNEILK